MDSSGTPSLPIVYGVPLTRRIIMGAGAIATIVVGAMFIMGADTAFGMVLGALIVVLALGIFAPIVVAGPAFIADEQGIDVRKSVAGSPRGKFGWHEIGDLTEGSFFAGTYGPVSTLTIQIKASAEKEGKLIVLSSLSLPRTVERVTSELNELKTRFASASSENKS